MVIECWGRQKVGIKASDQEISGNIKRIVYQKRVNDTFWKNNQKKSKIYWQNWGRVVIYTSTQRECEGSLKTKQKQRQFI